jgi:hypothetical protein
MRLVIFAAAAVLAATSASAQQLTESEVAAKIKCDAVEIHEDGSVTWKQPLDLPPWLRLSGKTGGTNLGGVQVEAVAARKCKK